MSHPWASNVGEHELPSGISVKLRPVRIHALTRAGAFSPEVLEVLSGDSEELGATMKAMAIVAVNSMVEPKVVLDPKKANHDKGVYAVDDLPDDDLAAIFQLAQGRELAESFRSDGPSDGDSADGEVLGDDA